MEASRRSMSQVCSGLEFQVGDEDDREEEEDDESDEDDSYGESSAERRDEEDERSERKLRELGQRFRKFMNFYGIIEDVSLLLAAPNATAKNETTSSHFSAEVNRSEAETEVDKSGLGYKSDENSDDLDFDLSDEFNSDAALSEHTSDAERSAHSKAEVGSGLEYFGQKLGLNSRVCPNIQSNGCDKLVDEDDRRGKVSASILSWLIRRSALLLTVAVVVLANLVRVHMLLANLIWEMRNRFDSSIDHRPGAISFNRTNDFYDPFSATAAISTQRATTLKSFLDNFRQQVLRMFAILVAFVWHANYRKFEQLFQDCRIYHSLISRRRRRRRRPNPTSSYNKRKRPQASRQELYDNLQLLQRHRTSRANSSAANLLIADCRTTLDGADNTQLNTYRDSQLEFYDLIRWRTKFASYAPFIHLLFNLIVIMSQPFIVQRTMSNQAAMHAASVSQTDQLNYTDSSADSDTIGSQLIRQLAQRYRLFNSINNDNSGSNTTEPSSSSSSSASELRFALYTLLELIAFHAYIHGPRSSCATCVSLVLAKHRQCIDAFNRQLARLVWRLNNAVDDDDDDDNSSAVKRFNYIDPIRLLKRYDIICTMHRRIESAFKWSFVLWFASLFVSCLMHIFAFTEAAQSITASRASFPATSGSSGPLSIAHQPIGWPNLIASLVPFLIMLTRLAFEAYPLHLIYSEAFKIESLSCKTNQLVLLVRQLQRSSSQVYDSSSCTTTTNAQQRAPLEPNLFEPMRLSAGDYFSLTRRSMCAFLAAIVTFSVMFIDPLPRAKFAGAARPSRPEVARATGSRGQDSATAALSSAAMATAATTMTHNAADDESGEDDYVIGDDSGDDVDDVSSDDRSQADNSNNNSNNNSNDDNDARNDDQDNEDDDAEDYEDDENEKAERTNEETTTLLSTESMQLTTMATGSRPMEAETISANNKDKTSASGGGGDKSVAPKLLANYVGHVRENEHLVELEPRLRPLNSDSIEVCDYELRNIDHSAPQTPFFISWLDRISGEATLEAHRGERLDCERQRNYTIGVRAIGCGGLVSNEALVSIHLDDVNEFSPEFERTFYPISYELSLSDLAAWQSSGSGGAANYPLPTLPAVAATVAPNPLAQLANDSSTTSSQSEATQKSLADEPRDDSKDADGNQWRHLVQVRAHDLDCSRDLYGKICRYELVDMADSNKAFDVDSNGNVRAKLSALVQEWLAADQSSQLSTATVATAAQAQLNSTGTGSATNGNSNNRAKLTCKLVAYDCGGKKSPTQATLEISVAGQCAPKWKDSSSLQQQTTRITYKPLSGERWLFAGTHLDLCARKCHRPTVSLAVTLDTSKAWTHTMFNATNSAQLDSDDSDAPQDSSKHAIRGGSTGSGSQSKTVFHCDRDSYAMVSKRRLCGSKTRALELLPRSSAFRTVRAHYNRNTQTSRNRLKAHSYGNNNQIDRTQRTNTSSLMGNVAAYALDGSYGRIAKEYATTLGSDSADRKLGRNDRYDHNDNNNVNGNNNNNTNTISIREGSSDNNKSIETTQTTTTTMSNGATAADTFVYRDQVYRFDGLTSAVIVPIESLLHHSSTASRANLSYTATATTTTTHHHARRLRHHHERKPSVQSQHDQHRTADDDRTGAKDSIVFGSRHTISFWMRHEAPLGKLAAESTLRNHARNRRHLYAREHLICATAADDDDDDDSEYDGAGEAQRDQYRASSNSSRWARQRRSRLVRPTSRSLSKEPIYAVYIRNCKLNLLIRQSSRQFDDDAGEPSKGAFESPLMRQLEQANETTRMHFDVAGAASGALRDQSGQVKSDRKRLRRGRASSRPTEWRWSVDNGALCDNKWHLYTLNVNYPLQAQLYVDGQQFGESYSNVHRVDSSSSSSSVSSSDQQATLAMRRSNYKSHLSGGSSPEQAANGDNNNNNNNNEQVANEINESQHIKTKRQKSATNSIVLSVGACWDAETRLMSGHFGGSLSGLVVAPNTNDPTSSIECLGRCSESLVSSVSARLASSRRYNAQLRSSNVASAQQSHRNAPGDLPTTTTATTSDNKDDIDDENSIADEQSKSAAGYGNSLVAFQDSAGRISLTGHDLLDVEEALAQIAYINRRAWPSIGRRSVTVDTSIECQSSTSQQQSSGQRSYSIPIKPMRIHLDVLPSTNLPAITIAGASRTLHTPEELSTGVLPLSSISVRGRLIDLIANAPDSNAYSMGSHNLSSTATTTSTTSRPNEELDYIDDDDSSKVRRQRRESNQVATSENVEACSVRVEPTKAIDEHYESLDLPMDLINEHDLYHYRSQRDGFLLIYGVDSVGLYERILRSIRYKNTNTTSTANLQRVLKVVCSDMNGRLVSNEHSIVLTSVFADLNDVVAGNSLDRMQAQLQQDSPVSALRRQEFHLDETPALMSNDWKLPTTFSPPAKTLAQPLISVPMLPETMQSTEAKLNRIAMAFLLFVISLILIMLVIALTNLREPSSSTKRPKAMILNYKDSNELDDDNELDESGDDEEEDENEECGDDEFEAAADYSNEATGGQQRCRKRPLVGHDRRLDSKVYDSCTKQPVLTAVAYDSKLNRTTTRPISFVDRNERSELEADWCGEQRNRVDGYPQVWLGAGDDFVVVEEYEDELESEDAQNAISKRFNGEVRYDEDDDDDDGGEGNCGQIPSTGRASVSRRYSEPPDEMLAWDEESQPDTTIVINPLLGRNKVVSRQRASERCSKCLRFGEITEESDNERHCSGGAATNCDEEDEEDDEEMDDEEEECATTCEDEEPCECHKHRPATHQPCTGSRLYELGARLERCDKGADSCEEEDDDDDDDGDECTDESGRYYELLHRDENEDLIANLGHYPCVRREDLKRAQISTDTDADDGSTGLNSLTAALTSAETTATGKSSLHSSASTLVGVASPEHDRHV